MYAETYGKSMTCYCLMLLLKQKIGPLDVKSFADRIWGDIYFNAETRKFTRKASDPESRRTFVEFVLDPLYKLYSQVLSEETDSLKETLHGLNIHIKPVMYKMDVRPLLKAVLDQFFGPSTGLVDMIVEHIPNPIEGGETKVTTKALVVNLWLISLGAGRTDVYWASKLRSCNFHEKLRP